MQHNDANKRHYTTSSVALQTGMGVIYPGKLTVVESFRIGCIGQMDENVMRTATDAAEKSLATMGVASAAPPVAALEERKKLVA